MKHIIIASAALTAVVLYSIFTFFYVQDFTCKITPENNIPITENIVMIRNIFDEKKKIMGFVVNKDHINDVENCIIRLENAVKYNDAQQIEENAMLLYSAVDELRRHNQSII
ncbi:MAG: hypothetical protein IKU47_08540 [Oscillospiraceae bacterium]|nr:hypothetical protein [Oscillospiraceae bacterium]